MRMRKMIMTDISVLDVLLHGHLIGSLTQIGYDRNLFGFTQDYINNPARLTLSLSFKDEFGNLIANIAPRQTKVPPFFSNLLPEGHMRRYLASHAGVKSEREFFLLWALGQDLPGAIVIRPAGEEKAWSSKDMDNFENKLDEQQHILRFSLAGVQLKFSAIMGTTGGLTIPAKGVGGEWIVKLPSSKFDSVPENEFAMMSLAREIGIDVPDIKLYPVKKIKNLPQEIEQFNDQVALAVKRFDRTENSTAIHMEDFAQVFNVYPEKKYSNASYCNIAQVIWAECGEQDIIEFIRRLVFNTLIGNADMHLKNWSFIYPDGSTPMLSPGYDFVSTLSYLPDNTMALKYARTKLMTEFSIDELRYLCSKAHLPETIILKTARETVQRFQDIWPKKKNDLTISNKVAGSIDRHLKSITLVRELEGKK